MFGSWGVMEDPVMELTIGMFAQICVIMLSASAAGLTLVDWLMSKRTARTSVIAGS